MPASSGEARNMVFPKTVVRGRSFFTKKKGTVKAIRIHNYGRPEVLKYEDAPRPEPQAGEVLVRVHAAGVNPIDWKVREGHMKDFWHHKFPLILGWDLSGVVEELGPSPAAGRFK